MFSKKNWVSMLPYVFQVSDMNLYFLKYSISICFAEKLMFLASWNLNTTNQDVRYLIAKSD